MPAKIPTCVPVTTYPLGFCPWTTFFDTVYKARNMRSTREVRPKLIENASTRLSFGLLCALFELCNDEHDLTSSCAPTVMITTSQRGSFLLLTSAEEATELMLPSADISING
jgi:hypothetical protein